MSQKDSFSHKIKTNPCWQTVQFIVHLIFVKIAERSEAKNAKRIFSSQDFKYFFRREAFLCFLDSLRSAMFQDNQIINRLVNFSN